VLTVGGALTGLAASAYVIVKAFGQYVPMFSVFAGGIVALVDGIIRNFDMLSEAINQTVEDFRLASGEGTDALGVLADFLGALVAPTRVVVDAVMLLVNALIRLTGVIGRMLGDLNALSPVLKAIGAVIGTIVAARMTVWLLSITKVVGAWKLLKGLNIVAMLVSIGMKAQVAAVGMNAAATSMGKMRLAGAGLAAVLGGPLGVIGAVVAIGTIAYEVFPPFKDFVDGITSSFVSLSSQIDEATNKLGEMGGAVRNTAENYARRLLGTQDEIFKSGYQGNTDDNELTREFVVTMNGKEISLNGMLTESEMRAEIQKYLDAETLAIVTTVNDHYAELNDQLARAQQKPIDMSTFIEKMSAIQGLLPEGHNPLDVSQILMNTYGQQGLAISKDQLERIVEGLPQTAGLGDALQAAIVNVLFDPSSVDTANRKMASDKWAAYVGKMVKWLGDNTISDESIFARFQNPAAMFSWGSAPSGALQDFIGSLDENLQRQFHEAWSARFGTVDPETADFGDTVKSGFATRYTALTDAAASALYEGYEQFEKETAKAYEKVLIDFQSRDFEGAADTIEADIIPLLMSRSLAPEAQEAWLKAIEMLETKEGGFSPGTADKIRKQLELKASKEVQFVLKLWEEATKVAAGALEDWAQRGNAAVDAALQAVVDPAFIVKRMSGLAGDWNMENAEKSKRDWLDQTLSATIPTEKDMREALKRIKSGSSRQRAAFKGLRSLTLMELLGSNTGAEREAGRDFADNYISGLVAQFNAAGGSGRRGRSIMRQVVRMLNDPTVPQYIKTQLEKNFRTALNNVEIDAPETGQQDKFMQGLYASMGISASGEGTSEKKPKKVFLRVHVSQKGSNKTRDTVLAAKTKIEGAIAAINALPWYQTGETSARLLHTGFVNGIDVKGLQNIAWSIRGRFLGVEWRKGGGTAGAAWASGFNTAVQNTIAKTLTFVASVTIGGSPPPAGPLHNIDKGGANAGTAWADGFGNAARDRIMEHTRRIQSYAYAEKMGLVTEEKFTGEKKVSVHIDVSSKDGTVDRAKQGEFRRGAMDALVAADLEHYVTVS
jgi:hypothetical protein